MAEAAAITHTLAEFTKVSNLSDFNQQLTNLPDHLAPCDLHDRSGYTGRPHAVFHELATSIISEDSVLEFARALVAAFHRVYQLEASARLVTYINIVTNNERRSALYFVCQSYRPVRAMQSLLRLFLMLGADPYLPDAHGVSCLHAAAARDQVTMLVILVTERGMNPEAVESKGRTPLHIAALEGHELAASVLIAWSTNLDKGDNEGLTPLHLAAFSQCYRIARHLLLAGASTKVKDSRGCTALDLALMRGENDISAMLKDPGLLAQCNPFHTSLKPSSNSYFNFILYHVVFFTRYFLVFAFIVPLVHLAYSLASMALFALSFLLYEVVSNMDPGYLVRSTHSLAYLFIKYNTDSVCAYCEVKRNGAVRHCQHCRKCVKVSVRQRFDHHCPWLHNCVGER